MNLRAFLGGVAAVTPDMPIAEALRLYDDRMLGEPRTVTLSAVAAAEVVALLRDGKLIQAVKEYRYATDVDLATAKDAVYAIRDRLDAEGAR